MLTTIQYVLSTWASDTQSVRNHIIKKRYNIFSLPFLSVLLDDSSPSSFVFFRRRLPALEARIGHR